MIKGERGPTQLHQRVDRLRRPARGPARSVGRAPIGSTGSMLIESSCAVGMTCEGVHRRVPERAARRVDPAPPTSRSSPQKHPRTAMNESPRRGSGTVGSGREDAERDRRGHLVRDRPVQLGVALQHLAGPVDRVVQVAGVHVLDRVQRELQGGDDPEVAATAAQAPEQVGVLVGLTLTSSPSAVTISASRDRVGGEPVPATEPAEAATHRVADDAHLRAAIPAGRPARGPRPPGSRRPTAPRPRRARCARAGRSGRDASARC